MRWSLADLRQLTDNEVGLLIEWLGRQNPPEEPAQPDEVEIPWESTPVS